MKIDDLIQKGWPSADGIGRLIALLRFDRRISQRQLADETGVDPALICRLERGRDIKLTTLTRVFAAMGYDLILTPRPNCEETPALLRAESDNRDTRKHMGLLNSWVGPADFSPDRPLTSGQELRKEMRLIAGITHPHVPKSTNGSGTAQSPAPRRPSRRLRRRRRPRIC